MMFVHFWQGDDFDAPEEMTQRSTGSFKVMLDIIKPLKYVRKLDSGSFGF